MQRSELLAVTKRELDCVDTESLEINENIRLEGALAFTDPERFTNEQTMLPRVAHVAGWAGEMRSPGDYTIVVGRNELLVQHCHEVWQSCLPLQDA